ncbi:MAG: VTT domain-containing protein [Steroidobacteraceae bacterium]
MLIFTSAALLVSVDAVYGALQRVLSAAEPLIAGHPYLGAVVFVGLAAVSAILAFFSSALLLPAAVYAWGNTVTLGLLWLGWLLGGMCTYALGRGLRRPQGKAPRTSTQLDFYLQRVRGEVTFALVLLLHLAVPSEIPGYLCGYLGVRRRIYVSALALAELPFAVGAVMLGDGVVNRQIGWLVGFGLTGAALSLCALWVLHRRLDQSS